MKLNKVEKLIIGLMLVLNIVYSVYMKNIDIKLFLVSMSGITSVVLSAKGHVYAYYLGVIYTLVYTYIAFSAKIYGAFGLNIIYYLPMQFVGIYNWSKHKSADSDLIKVNKLSVLQKTVVGSVLLVSMIALGYALKAFGDISPFIDSFTTTITIVAMYLCVKRFKEHWVLWIFVNGASVALWINGYLQSVEDSIFMIIMWSIFLINAVYGVINWNKMEKKK
jgi:nicotinamide mononucleotide transporter